MEKMISFTRTISLFLVLFQTANFIQPSKCQSYIGINYGQLADNLPSPTVTANLLKSTAIQKVRLYKTDPAVVKAFANTGIGMTLGVDNGDIPSLASDPSAAKSWLDTNVLPFYPASNVIMISVGNEVIFAGDENLKTQLVPAMKNLMSALDAAGISGGKIKVSTVNAMTVLQSSDPPSSGRFEPGLGDLLKEQLQFLSDTGSPFAINPYPFFAYQSDPRPETLAFCLFQPNAGRVDSGNGIKYMNMFDAQVDAIRSALNAAGFKGVEIVVAETGWPYKGDANEVGPSIDNAKDYNGNLVSYLRSKVGTPLMPGKSVDTYIFAMYDEDLKPGPASERSFGLFNTDLTMTYDIGLMSKTAGANSSKTPSPSSAPVSSSGLSQPPSAESLPVPSATTAASPTAKSSPLSPPAPSSGILPTRAAATTSSPKSSWSVPRKAYCPTLILAMSQMLLMHLSLRV